MSRIGILETSSPDPARLRLWEVFKQRLRELGHAEGRDVEFETRWANGNPDRLPGLSGKRLALLRELVPDAAHLAVLWDQTNPGGNSWRAARVS